MRISASANGDVIVVQTLQNVMPKGQSIKVKNKGTQSAFTQSQFQVSHPGRESKTHMFHPPNFGM